MKRTLLAIVIAGFATGLVGGASAQESDAERNDNQAMGEVAQADDGEEMQTDPGEQATSAEPSAEREQQARRDDEESFEKLEPTGLSLDPSLAGLQVSEIKGMSIINNEGESIGEAEKVLRHKDGGDLHAVVSVGGFWGLSAPEVALPLVNMQLEGEQLVLQGNVGEKELDDLATGYSEGRYEEVDGDMTLSGAMER